MFIANLVGIELKIKFKISYSPRKIGIRNKHCIQLYECTLVPSNKQLFARFSKSWLEGCGGGHLFDGGCACLILDPLGGGVALMRGGGGAYSSGALNRDDTVYSYTCFFL